MPITPTAPVAPANNYGFNLFSQSLNPANYTLPSSNPATNVTGQAQGNNLASAPDLSSLTNLVNQLNLQAQQTANAGRIPNDPALEAQSSSNIGSLLGGNIPQDVVTQLAQQAAERGVSIGSPGSDNANSSLLRSLGLTSLDLQQLGQQNLTAAVGRNPVAPLFDPTSQLINPYQQGTLNNEANKLALAWASLLNQGRGGYGGRSGTGTPTTPTTPDMSWFSRALASAGGLNQPVGAPNVLAPSSTTYDPNNPFDPLNQYQNVVSSPTQDTSTLFPTVTSRVGYDISSPPTSLGYDQPIDTSTIDPFNLYGSE